MHTPFVREARTKPKELLHARQGAALNTLPWVTCAPTTAGLLHAEPGTPGYWRPAPFTSWRALGDWLATNGSMHQACTLLANLDVRCHLHFCLTGSLYRKPISSVWTTKNHSYCGKSFQRTSQHLFQKISDGWQQVQCHPHHETVPKKAAIFIFQAVKCVSYPSSVSKCQQSSTQMPVYSFFSSHIRYSLLYL